MNDAFIRIINQADVTGRFLNASELDALSRLQNSGQRRIKVVTYVAKNSSSIISDALYALVAEQPGLIAPGGGIDTTRKMAACLRDMEIILRYITYAMLCGDTSVLEDRCLNGLRETYISLGVSRALVAAAIQKMKEVILNPSLFQKNKKIVRELEISEIRKAYPKQWITIEITKYENGFPSRGKVLYHDHNIANLTEKISHLNGDKIYTFFSSKISDSPEPITDLVDRNSPIFSPEYRDTLIELASYFDISAASVS